MTADSGAGRRFSGSGWGWIGLFGAFFAAQILLYHQAMAVKPAGDDFGPALNRMIHGERINPLSFYLRNDLPTNYRPTRATLQWLCVTLPGPGPFVWLRVLHFLVMAIYAAAVVTWLRLMPVARTGAVAAAMVSFFHPVLAAPLGSIDGFDGLLSTACMWLGASSAVVYRNRLPVALAVALLCFAVVGTTKEYGLALVPLAPLALVFFRRRRRFTMAILMVLVLSLALVALIGIRRFTIPPGYGQGLGYLSSDPKQWIQNAALFVVALLFTGNSVWAFVHQGPAVAVLVLVVAGAAAGLLGIGLGLRIRVEHRRRRVSGPDPEGFSAARWTLFLSIALAAASTPMLFMSHVSEMYAVGMVLPLALLAGLAAEGWCDAPRRWRIIATGAAMAMIVSSCLAASAKVDGLRAVGEKAEQQANHLLSFLPAEARDLRVAAVFLNRDLPPRRTYSVFRMGDEALMGRPHRFFDWWRPGRGLELELLQLEDQSQAPLGSYDLVLLWNAGDRRFTVLSHD